jgi:hypothetical protein
MRHYRWLLLFWALWASAAQAHVASNGFLNLEVRGRIVTGSIELAVRDVELAIGVDANRDRHVTWGELRSSEPRLATYVLEHLALRVQDSNCPIRFGSLRVNPRVDGNYAWLAFVAQCLGSVRELQIRYELMEGIDPSHRGLLKLTAGSLVQTAVLGGTAALPHPGARLPRTFRPAHGISGAASTISYSCCPYCCQRYCYVATDIGSQSKMDDPRS